MNSVVNSKLRTTIEAVIAARTAFENLSEHASFMNEDKNIDRNYLLIKLNNLASEAETAGNLLVSTNITDDEKSEIEMNMGMIRAAMSPYNKPKNEFSLNIIARHANKIKDLLEKKEESYQLKSGGRRRRTRRNRRKARKGKSRRSRK
jgi:hypothetical protein